MNGRDMLRVRRRQGQSITKRDERGTVMIKGVLTGRGVLVGEVELPVREPSQSGAALKRGACSMPVLLHVPQEHCSSPFCQLVQTPICTGDHKGKVWQGPGRLFSHALPGCLVEKQTSQWELAEMRGNRTSNENNNKPKNIRSVNIWRRPRPNGSESF